MAQAINCMWQSPKSLLSMNIILWATQCSGPRYGHPRQQSCSRCLGAITLEEMADSVKCEACPCAPLAVGADVRLHMR